MTIRGTSIIINIYYRKRESLNIPSRPNGQRQEPVLNEHYTDNLSWWQRGNMIILGIFSLNFTMEDIFGQTFQQEVITNPREDQRQY